jgi:hypothetical protein
MVLLGNLAFSASNNPYANSKHLRHFIMIRKHTSRNADGQLMAGEVQA